ncbi:MAG: CAP domain-containing protein [Lactimicrobium massiliense]|nr:CAP domain-containing protein [Lactimicrobium massiliense]MDD6559911.1 CAP domain-containing protein [Lactimicrobium massiliense]
MKKHVLHVCTILAALCLVSIPLSTLPVSAEDTDGTTKTTADDAMLKEYPTTFSAYENYSDAFRILQIVNTERAKENFAPLTMDQSLLDTAMLRGHEVELYFSHRRPDGYMYYSANTLISGENIALAYSADQAMDLWMNSSGHKANILDSEFTSTGIGVIKSPSGISYYVQCFGRALANEANASDYTDGSVSRTVNARGDFIDQCGTLSASDNEIAEGTAVELTFDIYNTFITEHGFTFDNIQFVSSDPSVASVSGNTVTGHKPGSVTITAMLNGDPSAVLSSTLTLTVMNPWCHDSNGWWYRNNDGSYPANTWKLIDGKWYFFNASGYMTTGWQYINGNWYYMSQSGDMLTGWMNNNGNWYYLNNSGAMVSGWQEINNIWYFFNSSGAMQTGWLYDNGCWYYLNNSGAMQTGMQDISGTTYLFAQNGAMLSGWQQYSDKWCYFDANGAMVNNRWVGDYYLDSDGYMAVNTTTPDGYQVGNDGRWVRSSSLIEGNSYIVNTRTLKFHYPWCHEVSRINSSNRANVGNSRNDLIRFGYEPCKICNP